MKQTKLILMRTALMSLFVILCSQAWAQLRAPGDDEKPGGGPAGKTQLKNAIVTFAVEGRTVIVDMEEEGTTTVSGKDEPEITTAGFVPDAEQIASNNFPAEELWMTYTGKILKPEVVSVVVGKGNDAINVLDKVDISYTGGQKRIYAVLPQGTMDNQEALQVKIVPKATNVEHPTGPKAGGDDVQLEGEIHISYAIKKADLHTSVRPTDSYAPLYYANPEFTGVNSVIMNDDGTYISTPSYFRYYNGETLSIEEFVLTPAQFEGHAVTTYGGGIGTAHGDALNNGDQGWVKPYPPMTNKHFQVLKTHNFNEETQQWEAFDDPNVKAYDVSANFVQSIDNYYIQIVPLSVNLTVTGEVKPEEGNTYYYNGRAYELERYDVTAVPTIEAPFAENLLSPADVRYVGNGNHISRTDAGTTYQNMASGDFYIYQNENFVLNEVSVTQGSLTVSPLTGVTVCIAGASDETKVYNGNKQSVSGWSVAEASTNLYNNTCIRYKGTGTGFELEPKASGTDVGTYYMNLTKDMFENRSNNFEDVTFTVKDGYVKINPLETVVTVTGNQKGGGEEGAGDYVYFDDALHTVTGYTWKADNDLYKEADFTFSGEAKVQSKKLGKNMMKLKASQFENTNKNFDVTFDTSNDGYLWITYYQATLEDDKDNTAAINKVVGTYASKADVTVKRTFAKGQWNTVCLPFDVTIADSPLAGAEVLELDAEETTYDAATGALSLNFVVETPVTVMEAGKPYVIKFATDRAPLVFKGAEFSKALQDVTVDLGEGKAITFKGTYKPVEFEEANSNVLLVGEGNKLFNPAAHAYVNPQRAYFELTGFEEAEEAPAFVLNFGGTTNISNVNMEKASNEYFDLSGRRVAQPTEKGIYIMNGKKVVVK